jgi:hypothetical protein
MIGPPGRGDDPPAPAASRDALAALGIVMAVAATAAVPVVTRLMSDKGSASECAQMFERYVDHRLRAARPDADPAKLEREKRALLAQTKAFEQCPELVTDRQAECALQAPQADAFERCLQVP